MRVGRSGVDECACMNAVVDAGGGARYVRAAETSQSDIHERVCDLVCVYVCGPSE
jgi:hypothetical protein